MSCEMRLLKHRGIYHVEISRNKYRSLRTKDEREAQAIFREMKKEQLRGRLFDLEKAKRITLSEFKDEYISYRESLKDLSTETIKKDNLSLKLLADVNGGNTLLVSVDIDKFKSVCFARGAAKITINGYLRHLKTAFKWAVEKTYLKKLPKIAMYKRLKKPEAELLSRILEPDEIKNFLRKAYKRSKAWGDYCLVTLWTGGRRRESLNIEFQKTDFKNERLTLTGKTGARTIPMLKPVKKTLERNKKDIGRVFPCWHPDTVSHWFQETAKDAGISQSIGSTIYATPALPTC
jgi:integrase